MSGKTSNKIFAFVRSVLTLRSKTETLIELFLITLSLDEMLIPSQSLRKTPYYMRHGTITFFFCPITL